MKKETIDIIEKLLRFAAQIFMSMIIIGAVFVITIMIVVNMNTPTLKNVNVYNCTTGEIIWSFEGKCYITESSDSYSIKFYDESGDSKVVTFMGNNINIISYELQN